jgi:spore coat protein A
LKRVSTLSLIAAFVLLAMLLPMGTQADAPYLDLTPQDPLDGSTVAKFESELPVLSVAGGTIQTIVDTGTQIEVDMREFKANMLPASFVPETGTYNGTWVWGYVEGTTPPGVRDTYTGPVMVATRGNPTEVKFVNELGTTEDTNVLAYRYSTDQSLHWANPNMAPKFVPVEDEPVDWVGNPEHYSGPIPAAVHLHGAEDPAAVDGGPDSWFTDLTDPEDDTSALHGPAFYSMDGDSGQNYCIYRYPNVQEAAPLWFHDHTLGATRLNVYMGLAGAYMLTDPNLALPDGLAALGLDRDGNPDTYSEDEYLIPLVVQDRMFDTNGQLYFPAGPPDYSPNPEHLYWSPEFFGDTIAVNGKVWPYLDVKAERYRFLLINGSNARTYILTFEGNDNELPIYQIGTDGGYLDEAVELDRLTIMPGERASFIVDFSGLEEGTELVLYNLGPDEPFKGLNADGDLDDGEGGTLEPADPDSTGQVMQFIVTGDPEEADNSFDPADNPGIREEGQKIVRLVNADGTLAEGVKISLTRELTLNEVAREEEITLNEGTADEITFTGGPLEALVNNTKWSGLRPDESDPNEMMLGRVKPVNGGIPDGTGNWLTEMPSEGATELWEIINTTADAHPIHLHLVQFQLLNRQAYDTEGYWGAYEAAFPGGEYIPAYGPPLQYGPTKAAGHKYGGNPDVGPYLSSDPADFMLPAPNELGWKDTIIVPPGMVTRFVVRWAPTDLAVTAKAKDLHYAFVPNDLMPGGTGAFFDYVWHCHIIDHEDNEMMRPDRVRPMAGAGTREYMMGVDY